MELFAASIVVTSNIVINSYVTCREIFKNNFPALGGSAIAADNNYLIFFAKGNIRRFINEISIIPGSAVVKTTTK